MSTIRALVTRWRKVGSFGRTGPRACEVHVGRVQGKLTIRIDQGGKTMAVLLDDENEKALANAIRENSKT